MTKAAASQRFRAIGATAADLAHKCNNLLTAIMAVVDAAISAFPTWKGQRWCMPRGVSGPNLPVILVSGYAEDSTLAELSLVVYLRKPFGAAELLDLVAGLTASSLITPGIAESAWFMYCSCVERPLRTG